MEAMYKIGIEIHYVSVLLLIGVVGFNIALLALSKQIKRYALRMRIVMPISATFLAVIIFTGMVAMAAKHLAFTLENSLMIAIALVIIGLEVRRYKILKSETDITQINAYELYRSKAFRILGIEIGLLLLMSGWMLV